MNAGLVIWYLFCSIPAMISAVLLYVTETGRMTGGGPAAVSGDEVIGAIWLSIALIISVICILIDLVFAKWTPKFVGGKIHVFGSGMLASTPFLVSLVYMDWSQPL